MELKGYIMNCDEKRLVVSYPAEAIEYREGAFHLYNSYEIYSLFKVVVPCNNFLWEVDYENS